MEGNTHLLQLIRKMRSQINKLERENRALRGELQVCRQSTAPPEKEAARGGGDGDARSLADGGEGPAVSPASLRGSIVAGPMLAPKEQADTTMTVRRYSTTLPPPTSSGVRSHKRPPGSGLPEVPGSAQPPALPATTQLAGGEEKGLEKSLANCLSNSHSRKMKLFQEHVYKCRAALSALNSSECGTVPRVHSVLLLLEKKGPWKGFLPPPLYRPGHIPKHEALCFLGKVKAVSFLLPMDVSSYAENQGSLKSPQNQSTKQLTTITEKDM